MQHVTIPRPMIELHYPDRWCSYCLQETTVAGIKIYRCPSCGRYSTGRTEIIEPEIVGVYVGHAQLERTNA